MGGSDSNRTVRVIPAPDQFGVATITLHAVDPEMRASSRRFRVTVAPQNDPPVLDTIADQVVDEDTALTVVVPCMDLETPLGSLILRGISDNQTLIPNAKITFSLISTQWTATILAA